jgi:multiple antibiotic resistance protein
LGFAFAGKAKPLSRPSKSMCATSRRFRSPIPLMAGPGAITATVLLAGHAHGDWILIASLLVVVSLVAACCIAAFFFAERISGVLGMTGNIVLSRLLGVLLAALAVQYVVDGVRVVLSG